MWDNLNTHIGGVMRTLLQPYQDWLTFVRLPAYAPDLNFLLPYIMLSDENKFPITVGLYTLLNRGSSAPSLYSLVVTGAMLSIIPLIVLFLALQRYWRTDIASGAVKQ